MGRQRAGESDEFLLTYANQMLAKVIPDAGNLISGRAKDAQRFEANPRIAYARGTDVFQKRAAPICQHNLAGNGTAKKLSSRSRRDSSVCSWNIYKARERERDFQRMKQKYWDFERKLWNERSLLIYEIAFLFFYF